MSFSIAAHRLMSVEFRDDQGAVVTDFAVSPTARTQRLMADYGILFRAISGGLALYYTTNPTATPALVAPIDGTVRFSFSLRAAGSDPSLVFADLSGAGGSHVLLDNLDAAGSALALGALTAGAQVGAGDHVFAGPQAYPAQVDLSGGIPARIEAQDRFSGDVAAQTPVNDPAASPPVAPPPGASSVFATVDIPDGTRGALRLVTPAPGVLNRLIYADDDVAAERAIGIVDLYWTGPQTAAPASTGREYSAAFRRRP